MQRSLASLSRSTLVFIGVALLIGASVALAAPASAPLDQGPPPPPPPDPVSTPAPGGGGEGTGFLAELEGFVWQNGDPAAPLGGVVVRYVSDGVTADATTDANGH